MSRRKLLVLLIIGVVSACGAFLVVTTIIARFVWNHTVEQHYSKGAGGVTWGYCAEAGCFSYPVEGADAKSFVVLNPTYAKDKARAYHQDEPIPAADPLSFTALSEIYAKDNQHVYFREDVIAGADALSFRITSGAFARDANDFYLLGQPLDVCSVDSFRDLGDGWQIDDKCAYKHGEKLNGADPSSFSVISGDYAKDRNHVYWEDEVIAACSVDSFRVLDEDRFWQVDDKCAYFQGNKLSDADPASFSIIGFGYAKDRNHIYLLDEIISCEACANDADCNKVVKPLPCPDKSE